MSSTTEFFLRKSEVVWKSGSERYNRVPHHTSLKQTRLKSLALEPNSGYVAEPGIEDSIAQKLDPLGFTVPTSWTQMCTEVDGFVHELAGTLGHVYGRL